LLGRLVPAARIHALAFNDFQTGVFAPAHLADILNVILLMMPAALVLASTAGAPSARSLVRDARRPAGAFALLLLLPAVLFLALFKPALGMWRDWDLYAFTAVGLFAIGCVLVRRWLADPRVVEQRARTVIPAIVFSAVMTLGWILVNADAERSAQRFEATLVYDQTASGYANESLARYYERSGRPARAAAAMDRAYAFRPNLRFLFKASTLHDQAGDTERAVRGLEEILERDSSYDAARVALLGILMDEDRAQDVLPVASTGISVSPGNYFYFYARGRALLALGRYDEGVRDLARARQLDPPAEIGREIGAAIEGVSRLEGFRQ